MILLRRQTKCLPQRNYSGMVSVMRKPTGIDALRQAVEMLGGPAKTGRILGYTSNAISNVIGNQGRKIPPAWCRAIERATGGKITSAMLRPDMYA